MILSIGKYIGDTKITMDEKIAKFGGERFLKEITGFDSIYVESKKTQIEMAKCAIQDCLSKRPEVSIDEIGLLIFTANTLSKLSPTVAITLVHELGMRSENMLAFDLNCNCGGALVAMHTAQSIMQQNPGQTKYAMVVACDKFDFIRRDDVLVTHTYGDSASAVLLDQTLFKRYAFVQGNNTKYLKELQIPRDNFANCNGDIRLYADGNPSIEEVSNVVIPQFQKIREEQDINIDEVSTFCFTQGGKKMLGTIAEALNIPMDKIPFVGKVYGYLGVSCPIIALEDAISRGKLKRNDLVWMWSLGAGISSSMMVFEY